MQNRLLGTVGMVAAVLIAAVVGNMFGSREASSLAVSLGATQNDLQVAMGRAEALTDEVLTLKGRATALTEEVTTLKHQLGVQKEYAAHLKRFYLPNVGELGLHGYRIDQLSNPFLAKTEYIRSIKKSAAGLDDLWGELQPLAEEFRAGSDTDPVIGAMLVVAAFYDYGNPPPNEMRTGCVSDSEESGFTARDLSFPLHMQSDIGCCTDFAMMLGSFLDYLGYESEVMTNPAHQFLRVKIGDRWDLVDATTRVYVRDYFSEEEKVIQTFAVGEDRVYPFKSFFVKALALEIDTYGPSDWRIVPRDEQNRQYGAAYLNDADWTSVARSVGS